MAHTALVVMAAGLGSRYGGLKQIDPFGPNKELIIDYSIYDALKAGFDKVVFVIKEENAELFRERIGKRIEMRVDTSYIYQKLEDVPSGFTIPAERQKPWGTAQAVLSCKEEIDTPFVALNADDFYGAMAFQALADFLHSAGEKDGMPHYAMMGYLLENTLTENGSVARGICTVDSEGYLKEIHERTRVEKFGDAARYTENGEDWVTIPRGSAVSMNIWGLTPDIFAELETGFSEFLKQIQTNPIKAEFYLPEFIGSLVNRRKAQVKVLPSTDRWYGVTYQADKVMVKQAILDLVKRGAYPENLWGE